MYISSDTNIWFDFEEIGFPEHPFLLDNDYFISDVTYHDDIRFSETVRRIVESNKLHVISVPSQEIALAIEMSRRYPTITIHDAIALSIAKTRGWILLSGDGRLRNAAETESVECHGTLWIYSQLKEQNILPKEEYLKALENLLDAVENNRRRLPKSEIIQMIREEANDR